MAAAAARQLSADEFMPVVDAPEVSPRPALELVPAPSETSRKGLACRWQFDPAERRLVATWELRSL